MVAPMSDTLRLTLAWFAAGVGWDLQGRVLDHFLDKWFAAVTWLTWLTN